MDIRENARQLRKDASEAEKCFWNHVRNRRLNGYKFKRQVPIGNYIADFLCESAALIVEIDGGQHMEQTGYDNVRTNYLQSQGYTVMRFWNNDVLTNIEGVLTALTLALSQRERGNNLNNRI